MRSPSNRRSTANDRARAVTRSSSSQWVLLRRLPDGIFPYPACRSEVFPSDASSTPSRPEEHAQAYRAGWVDDRFGETGSFVDNPNLPRWHDTSERLDYYRGHRAGSEARNAAMGGWEEQVRERGSPAAEEVSEMG